jgi:hypothetical protein
VQIDEKKADEKGITRKVLTRGGNITTRRDPTRRFYPTRSSTDRVMQWRRELIELMILKGN